MKPELSIVVPCYNEEKAVLIYYQSFLKLPQHISYELLFVDDGSKDRTLTEIKKIADQDQRVRYLSFSRNFGKESAIFAGLEHASADYVVTMDVDLQDPLELIPEMYETVKSGQYDSVATRRVDRKGEPPVRSFFARLFYKIMRKISNNLDIVDGARDFRMMNRKFVNAILEMKEYNRFSKGIYGWVGFQTKWIEYENIERSVGETKWSFWKLLVYALDGIVAFSTMPLVISTLFGGLFSAIALFAIVFVIVRYLIWGDPVAGWASTICILLLIGGLQMLFTGILGQYISKIYMETKQRPIYIVRDSNTKKSN
jgi:glycosyltransferase involved in cell wall biosynthesis